MTSIESLKNDKKHILESLLNQYITTRNAISIEKVFLSITFLKQVIPGTFEYTINYLMDNEIDLSDFHKRFRNEETGALAYNPTMSRKCSIYI